MQDKLSKYKSMRKKGSTPEPFTSKKIDSKKLSFVVQKHQATALHYDFRLETDGVMPSWAIPKGPTLDSSVRRLAMMTEDHPLDYRHFEGVIPEGNYGAGSVIVWDQGTYYPELEKDGTRIQIKDKKEAQKVMAQGLKKGEIKMYLMGKKLKGSFALVKTHGFGGKNAWLLIKHKDEHVKAGWDAKDYDFSEISGKSLSEVK